MTPLQHAPGHPLFDSAALRGVEMRAAAQLGDDFILMSRAGCAAWRELLRLWPQAMRLIVVCGPGNNGGDGYVLARQALEAGRHVLVLHLADHAPRTAQAQCAQRGYLEAGGTIKVFDGVPEATDLIVDALFGIGLRGPADADAAALIDAINASGVSVFSLDVPSGVDADRGGVPGVAVRAMHTLQFMAGHAGLHTGEALAHAGTLAVADLDLPPGMLAHLPPAAIRMDVPALTRALPPRSRNAHKGDSGHVLCIGGDHGLGGSIMLTAEATLRSGAGLVSVATRDAHVAPMLVRRAEAMARGVESAAALQPMLDRADVVAIGPGLGQGAWGRSLLDAALSAGRALVMDADALNLLASGKRALPADAVITPHPGEAARLLGVSSHEVQADRLEAVRLLGEKFGCVVVLKGAGTLVSALGETPRVIAAGNPGMAVAGMGDVLTGCIAALRAQGLQAFEAACVGALLHAMAGDAAAARDGERGLLPSDLFPQLRAAINGRRSP